MKFVRFVAKRPSGEGFRLKVTVQGIKHSRGSAVFHKPSGNAELATGQANGKVAFSFFVT